MVGVHVLNRPLFDLDDFRSVSKIGDDVACLEIGCSGEPAVEMRRRHVQSPEREIAKAGIKVGFRVAGEKAPLHPRPVRRVALDIGKSTQHGEPRMGERIALAGGCEQHGRAGIGLDIGRVGRQPRHQDHR